MRYILHNNSKLAFDIVVYKTYCPLLNSEKIKLPIRQTNPMNQLIKTHCKTSQQTSFLIQYGESIRSRILKKFPSMQFEISLH